MVGSENKTGIVKDGFPSLPSDQLHIWKTALVAEPRALEICRAVLSEKELERIPYFKFEKVRNNFIVSQGALRILLGAYLGIEPNLVQFGREKKGKPYSIDDPALHFNISNSGNICVFAFSRTSEVGIDIEYLRELADLDELIEKNFSAAEIGYINKKSDERSRRFFRLWTIKESYLKAIGEGMRLTPDSLEFSIGSDSIKLLSVSGVFEIEDWKFEEFTPDDEYVGTITYMGDKTKISEVKSFESTVFSRV